MKINGDPPELGFWQKGDGPISMQLAQNDVVWLTGEKVRPYNMPVTFKHGVCPTRITYKYLIRNDQKNTTVWEREPSRFMDIQDPKDYRGELGIEGSNVSQGDTIVNVNKNGGVSSSGIFQSLTNVAQRPII